MTQKNQPNSTESELLSERMKNFKKLSSLYNSEGGKLLVKTLLKDVVQIMERIGTNYSTMTHQQFIAAGCNLGKTLDMVQVIAHSSANIKQTEEMLENLISEAEATERENKVTLP